MRSRALFLIFAGLIFAGCSTTRRLGEGEVLYTGVRRMRIVPDSGVVVTAAASSAARRPLSVAPNNPLVSPWLRTPLPIGLWAYNYLYTPREEGLGYWLYKRFAKDPVLISGVQPEVRAVIAARELENHGYFGSDVTPRLLYRKRGRKAKVEYRLRVAPPFHYTSIEYPQADSALQSVLEPLWRQSLLRTGAQYNLDTLTLERRRVSDSLRDRGCYYFRPEYLGFEADTSQAPRGVALRMLFDMNMPPVALRRFRVGDVTVRLEPLRGGTADTLHIDGLRVISPRPPLLREKLLPDLVTLHSGDIYSVAAQRQTLTALNKTGVFRSVNLSVAQSSANSRTLDVNITVQEQRPLVASVETDVTSKSNSFLGPGVALRLGHNNLFRGGELFSLRFTGSYEWRTGRRKGGSRLNSYEVGADLSLEVPRIVPSVLLRRGQTPSTDFKLSVRTLNRPDFFRLVAFSGSATWNFRSSEWSHHSVTPLRLTYNRMLHTSPRFDSIMDANAALALSFRNQFVPATIYTYTFDRGYGTSGRRRFYAQTTFTSAGNLLSCIMRIAGDERPQRLFGNHFSQFVKFTAELKCYLGVGRRDNTLVTRLFVGAGCAYYNSRVMPYSEQFYIGGANSIRAFTVRSVGPGSYRPPSDDANGYLDQTGDMKLEANIEYRFAIVGRLHGAVFLDSGNIWLLRRDPERPGATPDWRRLWRDIALGTGCGLRYDLGFLVLRADLGVGLHAPWRDVRRGYFNVPLRDGLGFHLAVGYPF